MNNDLINNDLINNDLYGGSGIGSIISLVIRTYLLYIMIIPHIICVPLGVYLITSGIGKLDKPEEKSNGVTKLGWGISLIATLIIIDCLIVFFKG